MRFPLRLSAGLYRQEAMSFFTGSAGAPPIFRYSPLVTRFPEGFRPGDSSPNLEWHSPHECMRTAGQLRARVIWLGGVEPLLHPEIGRVTAALVESGRQVFLHTSGLGLRKRMHEFRPHSRLYLTLECLPDDGLQDPQGARDAFSKTVEAIRAAKLSGFYVCAHVTVDAATGVAAFRSLLEALRARDLDGFIVSSGGALGNGSLGRRWEEKLACVRALIESPGWRRFSCLLEKSGAMRQKAAARVRGSEVGAYEERA